MESFDAYYHWLGIPPEEQPPDHYRLLGLRRFEDNPTVISHAADRQMAHLRTFQTGRHSVESQRLLNETAAARVCLLNADKKAAYDERLRRETEPPPDEASVPEDEATEPDRVTLLEQLNGLEPNGRATAIRRAGTRPALAAVLVALAAGIGVVVLAVLWRNDLSVGRLGQRETRPAAGTQSSSGETSPEQPAAASPKQPTPEPPQPDDEPVASEPPAPSVVPPKEDDEPKSPEPPPSAVASPPAQTPVPAAVAPSPPPPAESVTAPTSVEPSVPAAPTEPAAVPQPANEPPQMDLHGRLARNPVPALDVQQRVAGTLEQIYSFSADRTPAETDALLGELLKHGERLEGTADERFVVLRKTVEVAAAAGRPEPMLQAIDLLDERYEIDPWDLRQATFKQMAAEVKGTAAARALLSSLEKVTQDALDADCYAAAEELAKAGNRASMAAGDAALRKKWKESFAAASRLRRGAERVRKMEEHLETSPNDSAVRDEVGQWYCFEREDWRRGLPHLARGASAALAALAESELRHEPTSAEEQLRLADAWWDFAARARKNHRDAIRRRAVHWYRLAEPELTGVLKLKVEKRLADFARSSGTPPEKAVRGRSCRCLVAAMGDDEFEMYVNGKLFMKAPPGGVLFAQVGTLTQGDIVTVRAVNQGGTRGFVCAILSAHGGLVVTGPAWRSYEPKSPDTWYLPEQVGPLAPVVAGHPAVAKRFRDQTRAEAASIWGAPGTSYLVLRIP